MSIKEIIKDILKWERPSNSSEAIGDIQYWKRNLQELKKTKTYGKPRKKI